MGSSICRALSSWGPHIAIWVESWCPSASSSICRPRLAPHAKATAGRYWWWQETHFASSLTKRLSTKPFDAFWSRSIVRWRRSLRFTSPGILRAASVFAFGASATGLAPDFSRKEASSEWAPDLSAKASAVAPCSLASFTLAPRATSSRAIVGSPCSLYPAKTIGGVWWPHGDLKCRSDPFSINSAARAVCPE